MKKRTKIVTTFTVYPANDDAAYWWEVSDENVLGVSSGVRITYREAGRERGIESDFIDITAEPSTLRSIAEAILRKADEQENEE